METVQVIDILELCGLYGCCFVFTVLTIVKALAFDRNITDEGSYFSLWML